MTLFISRERRHRLTSSWRFRMRVGQGGVAGLSAQCAFLAPRVGDVSVPASPSLGPDPASSQACAIGGVIANNAGGMRCTAQKDAYHTVSALTFVTPSGAAIDTPRPHTEKEFVGAEPQLAEGLLEEPSRPELG